MTASGRGLQDGETPKLLEGKSERGALKIIRPQVCCPKILGVNAMLEIL